MKSCALGVVLLGLCLSFGCAQNTDEVNQLQQSVRAKDAKIDELEGNVADRDAQVKKLEAAYEQMKEDADALQDGSDATAGLRKVKWSRILNNAKKMFADDGKYSCFYAVLEKTDADSVAAATKAFTDKGYQIKPSPWEGVLIVSSPQKTEQELVMLQRVDTVRNSKPLNDGELAEVRAVPGVKSVWPQSVLFFPVTIGKDIPGKSLYIDATVIALPPEFFEAEADRLDLKEFARYDGAGAQVIVPRIMVEYFNHFFRYTEGMNLEYEKSLTNSYFKVRLPLTSLFTITGKDMVVKDVKVVGYTDRIKEIVIIVSPEVVDDWNKLLMEE